jgi:hypothetical protein
MIGQARGGGAAQGSAPEPETRAKYDVEIRPVAADILGTEKGGRGADVRGARVPVSTGGLAGSTTVPEGVEGQEQGEGRESKDTRALGAAIARADVKDARALDAMTARSDVKDARTAGGNVPRADDLATDRTPEASAPPSNERDASGRVTVALSAGSTRAKRAERSLSLESRQQIAEHQTDRATPGLLTGPPAGRTNAPVLLHDGMSDDRADGSNEAPRDSAPGARADVSGGRSQEDPTGAGGSGGAEVRLTPTGERPAVVPERRQVPVARPEGALAPSSGHLLTYSAAVSKAGAPLVPQRVFSPEAESMILDQVIREVQLHISERASELRVRLVPESLGEVTMQVRMEEGRLSAQIDVTQAAVKTVLESGIGQLRAALQQQGIDLDRIDIFASTTAMQQESGSEHPGGEPHRQGGRRQGEADGVGAGRQARFLGYNTIDMTM